MARVTMKPTTKRLKQLIKAHGPSWLVLQRSPSVQCFGGEPGLFVESPGGWHTRWVRPSDIIEEVDNGTL